MRKGRGWRKILVNGLFLDGRDGLREELDYAGDFVHYEEQSARQVKREN